MLPILNAVLLQKKCKCLGGAFKVPLWEKELSPGINPPTLALFFPFSSQELRDLHLQV